MQAPQSWDFFFQHYKDRCAFIERDGSTLSFSEWQRDIQTLAKKLAFELGEKKVPKQSAIALQVGRPQETLNSLFALWLLNYRVVMFAAQAPRAEIENAQQKIPFEKLIYASEIFDLNPLSDADLSPADPSECLVIFTSGSSGGARGVSLGWNQLYYSALGTLEFYGLVKQEAKLAWVLDLPLHHISGIMIAIRCLVGGLALACNPEQAGILGYKLCRSFVPAQLETFLNQASLKEHDWHQLIVMGGQALSEDSFMRAQKLGLPISMSYGMSEACAQVSATPLDYRLRPKDKLSSGVSLPYRKLSLDAQGEIHIAGATVANGYWEHGQFKAFQGQFQTSDLGIFHGDYLTMLGRCDQVFMSGGENINPHEIEQILLQHPQIQAAVVVPVQDTRFGQVPVAWLGLAINQQLDPELIKAWCQHRLHPYKIPKRFLSLPDLDKNLAIKPSRQHLTKLANQWP